MNGGFTLTDFSYGVRKYAPYGVLVILIILIIFYSFQLLFILSKPKETGPQVTINPVFDKIRKPYIADASPSAGLRFTLDTVEGRPVTATSSAKIYFMPPAQTRFNYKEKAYLMAKSLGLDTEAASYRLLGSQVSLSDAVQRLTVDIKNFNFTYSYGFDTHPEVLSGTVEPNGAIAQDRARELLRTVGRYPDELTRGKTNVIYFSYDPATKAMTELKDAKGANLVEVDFYRPDKENIPIVTPRFFNSQNYALLAFYENGSAKVLRAQIQFYETSDEQVGLYPVRSGEEAYEFLKQGFGTVIANPRRLNSVTIRKIFLAYYDPDVYQDYFQPVYVYLGDDNFVAYVPAVSDAYLIQ